MSKIKILSINHKPTKSGKGIICGIKTRDKNGMEVWVNGWGNETTKSWAIGQEVELEVYQEEWNGQLRLKFKDVPNRNIFAELDAIQHKLDLLLGAKQTGITTAPVTEKSFAEEMSELASDFGGEVVQPTAPQAPVLQPDNPFV